MKQKLISGIQQIGIGVSDVKEAWKWYKEHFGTDIRVFEDDTVAELMLPYTGGEPRQRHAALALNMQGGGGFEIWQYKGRTPLEPKNQIQLGDLGIFTAKIKCESIEDTFHFLKEKSVNLLSDIVKDPNGNPHFFIKDPFNNIFQLVESKHWYKNENKPTGGSYGAIIGVSDIEEAKKVYMEILEYDQIVYDKEGKFEDLKYLPGGDHAFRRVLLTHKSPRKGGLCKLLGESYIELVQSLERKPNKIYESRFWGDLGFIHLCYDIYGMDALKKECKDKGYAFTVNSNVKHNENDSFDMGEAAGHFSYIEDKDGTLIEFVETHRIPISKKLGWYFNLRSRDPEKPMPDWILKALSIFNRVKKIK